MSPYRRRSRADKRRRDQSVEGKDRRHNVPPDLIVRTQIKDDNLLVWIKNPLISSNCYPLKEAIANSLQGDIFIKRIILNMENVPYMDTGGISLLLQLHKIYTSQNRKFILYLVIPRMKEIIEIFNLSSVFDIRDH